MSRCTRFDISFVIARLAGFVGASVAHTAEWSLIMKSADDDWEDLRLSVVRDGVFRRIQSQADGVKRKFLLDRVGKSSARTSEHEFDRVRVD